MNTEQARKDWEKIRMGWWYTLCCDHDLCQISHEEELAGMVGDLKNPKKVFPETFGVWETREEADEALKNHSH